MMMESPTHHQREAKSVNSWRESVIGCRNSVVGGWNGAKPQAANLSGRSGARDSGR